MQPSKSQLDTIALYLRKLVSEDKTAALVKKVRTEEKADELIKLFETRRSARLQDVERILE